VADAAVSRTLFLAFGRQFVQQCEKDAIGPAEADDGVQLVTFTVKLKDCVLLSLLADNKNV
jgi:hypothetical protein